MKQKLFFRAAFAAGLTAAWLLGSGCSTCQHIQKSKAVAQVQANPGASSQGWVEFYTLSSTVPVPVFLVDDRGKPILLGSAGLKQGEKYCYAADGATGEKLRVEIPRGTYQFMVERDGPRVKVPVAEGQTTPVELDYAALGRAVNYVTYRLDTRVFEPRPENQAAKTEERK